MNKQEVFTPSRRMMIGAVAAALAPPARAGREIADAGVPEPEGTPGPGRILVWVDEQHWRALVAAASLDPPMP